MESDEIKFNLNCSGSAKLNSDGSFSYENDCEKKLQSKLKPIFEAIAKLGGDEGKIDTAEERNLLKKLQSVFAADGDANVSDEELAMLDSFSSSDDVKAFINKKVAEKSVTPTGLEEENSPLDSQQRPVSDRKAAYNMTITKKRTQELKNAAAALTDAQKQDYTVQRGDGLWKIAYNLLGGSSANPREKDIQTVIAYIAELNDIADVTHPGSKMYVGKTIKVPAAGALENLTISTAPQGGGAITTSAGSGTRGSNVLGRSSIKIKPEPDLNGYTKEELTGDDASAVVKKWTKEGAADIYTLKIEGLGNDVFVEGSSAEAVKEMKTKIEAEIAKIKGPQDGEDDEAKAKRLDANLKAIKEIAKTSGYDKEVILGLLQTYMGTDKVDVKSNDYNAFIQDLVKTLDPEVIEKILSLENNQTFDKKFNQQTYNMICKLYQSILSKERSGGILTDNEARLKTVIYDMTNSCSFNIYDDSGNNKYNIEFAYNANKVCYKQTYNGVTLYAFSPDLLEDIGGKLNAEGADKAAIFSEYKSTDDAILAQKLLINSITMGAAKQDVIDLINHNDMYVIKELPIGGLDMSNDDQKAIVVAAIARIRDIYTNLQKGDPNNMRYLDKAMKIIDKYADSLPNGDDKDAVEAIKTEILESYFDKTVTGEGDDAVTTYTYKGRRLTKEEAEAFSNNGDSYEMEDAIRATVTLDDLGPNGFAQVFENASMIPYYEKFVENMTTEQQVLDFIGKVQYSSAIPFDKVLEKFGESEEVKKELMRRIIDHGESISDENRILLLKDYLKEDKTLDISKLTNGITLKNLTNAFPICSNKDLTQDETSIYNAIINGATLDNDNVSALETITGKVNHDLKIKTMEFLTKNKIRKEHRQQDIYQLLDLQGTDENSALVICKNVNINDCNAETKKAMQNKLVMELTDYPISIDELNTIHTNGWIDNLSISGRRHGTLFRKEKYFNTGKYEFTCGEKTLRLDINKNNKGTLRIINKVGAEMGVQLFADVVGANGSNSSRHEDAKKIIDKINKDNVKEVIRSFNMACKNDQGENYTGIFEYILDENGMNKCVDKIKQALCEAYPHVNLDKLKTWKELDKWCKKNIY